jgi:hypothetical protein
VAAERAAVAAEEAAAAARAAAEKLAAEQAAVAAERAAVAAEEAAAAARAAAEKLAAEQAAAAQVAAEKAAAEKLVAEQAAAAQAAPKTLGAADEEAWLYFSDLMSRRPPSANVVNSPPRLIHLTDAAGKAGIERSGQIIGRQAIFAVPEAVGTESTAMKVLRTGVPPSKTANAVPIPDAATGLFSRPVPIGPYSAWKYFGETYYAPGGAINTATGAFTRGSSLIGPRLLMYGPDGLIYLGVITSAGITWYVVEKK